MNHDFPPKRKHVTVALSLVLLGSVVCSVLCPPSVAAAAKEEQTVEGSVTDSDGTPLKGISVSASLDDGSRRVTTTDADGTFGYSTAAVHGRVTITATASDGASVTILVDIARDSPIEIPPLRLRTGAGATGPSTDPNSGAGEVSEAAQSTGQTTATKADPGDPPPSELAFSGVETDLALVLGGMLLAAGTYSLRSRRRLR